jgi:hypothetical protein
MTTNRDLAGRKRRRAAIRLAGLAAATAFVAKMDAPVLAAQLPKITPVVIPPPKIRVTPPPSVRLPLTLQKGNLSPSLQKAMQNANKNSLSSTTPTSNGGVYSIAPGNFGYYTGSGSPIPTAIGNETVQVSLAPQPITSPQQLESIQQTLQNKLDSMNDLSDQDSTELQMLMTSPPRKVNVPVLLGRPLTLKFDQGGGNTGSTK